MLLFKIYLFQRRYLGSPIPRSNTSEFKRIVIAFRMGEGISDVTVSLSALETVDQVSHLAVFKILLIR